jgi:hypothetical protein
VTGFVDLIMYYPIMMAVNIAADDDMPLLATRMEKKQQEEKRNKVVSFRLSERDYERHLSMAKLCYENGLTKGPDIVSYIRLSMECLWQYINNS